MAGDTQTGWLSARGSKGAANNRERAHTGNTLPPRLIASSKHGRRSGYCYLWSGQKNRAPTSQRYSSYFLFCKRASGLIIGRSPASERLACLHRINAAINRQHRLSLSRCWSGARALETQNGNLVYKNCFADKRRVGRLRRDVGHRWHVRGGKLLEPLISITHHWAFGTPPTACAVLTSSACAALRMR